MFVKEHPNCTRRDVTRGLALRSSSSTARIKELIDSGLVIESGTSVDSVSGKTVKTLKAATDYLHKSARDRVRVIVHLVVDEDGNYHAHAKVDGGQAYDKKKRNHVIMSKEVTLVAPYPNTYRSLFMDETTAVVDPRDTFEHRRLIIEG